MIPIPSGVKVWIATGITDMRRGMNRCRKRSDAIRMPVTFTSFADVAAT